MEIKVKKLLIGLMALGSISAFANEIVTCKYEYHFEGGSYVKTEHTDTKINCLDTFHNSLKNSPTVKTASLTFIDKDGNIVGQENFNR